MLDDSSTLIRKMAASVSRPLPEASAFISHAQLPPPWPSTASPSVP
jgi:hypothetical protein